MSFSIDKEGIIDLIYWVLVQDRPIGDEPTIGEAQHLAEQWLKEK